MLSQGKWNPLLGFWWVHVPTLLIALWLIWRSQQLPSPKKQVART